MITQIFKKITQIVSSVYLICVIGFLICVIKGGTFVTPYLSLDKELFSVTAISMSRKYITILTLLFLFLPATIFAEIIILKSGRVMEGRIIRKTDKEIKVDIHGVLTSYYLDEVKSINGQEPDVYTPVVIQEEKVLAPAQEKEALNKGLAYLDRQMYDEAIAEFTKAIELNSRFTEAYYDRGLTYYKKIDFNQAISDYTKAIEISPNDADVYYNRGLVYSLNKEYDKAWEDIHKAESLGYKVNPDFRKELQKVSKREN